MISYAETRLAVYGTLAPGRSNHHQLAELKGEWRTATARGHFYPAGKGTTRGYPAFTPDLAAEPVEIQLFESPDLPAHWARLDAFEGEPYRRTLIQAVTSEGEVEAYIYAVD